MKTVDTLIIPAAGAGTRLRPATYVTPKELLRLVDKPIAYYLLAEAYLAGIRRVVFITHKDNPLTKEFFESPRAAQVLANLPGLAVSCLETDARGGDGQALLCAEKVVGAGPFAVTMGDLITLPGESILAELMDTYRDWGAAISVEEIPREKTGQYGIIDTVAPIHNLYRVVGIVEKPKPENAPSNLAMTGKYILPVSIFAYLRQLKGGSGELKLSNALNAFAKENLLYACAARTKHYDTGTKLDLLKAEIAFSLAHPDLKDKARQAIEQALEP
jgi:UTP--glucose-1-phosphate uridylyltransferase